MKQYFIPVLSILIICLAAFPASAIDLGDLDIAPDEYEQIQEELDRRNISERQLMERLREKGVDVEEIPREELPAYQGIIMDTIAEMEAEQRREAEEDPELPPDIVPEPEPADPDEPEPITEEEEEALIYGHEPFLTGDLEVYQTTEGARVPDTYILGVGDNIRVNIFGDSQVDMLLEINDEGYVRPAETPQIFLKGLTIAQARAMLYERLSQYYTFRADQFSLTIHTTRTITVNIFGETHRKGSFTLSALNTAFNALVAGGGPTEIGSVRNIQHIRGEQRRTLDVYAFMHDPGVKFDFDLQHNDIIYVPVAQKVVDLRGAVKRPKRYELTPQEELTDLISYAGGINYDTYPNYVQVERIEDGEWKLREYELHRVISGEVSVELQDGDIVRLRQVEKELEQFIEIEGSVFYDGRYDLREQPTLNRLLDRAELRLQAMTELIFIERIQPDESVRIIPVAWDEVSEDEEEFPLEPRDLVRVFDQERYRSLATISVTGNVRNTFERQLPFDERMSLSHALALAGGAEPTAAEIAYVVRTDLMNPEIVEHIPVNLVQDYDFQLQPGDQLSVYTQSTYTNIPQISIQGAVNDPFSTQFDSGLNITDLLKMAGGFTEAAELSRIDIFRLRLEPGQGTRFDRISLEVDEEMALLPEHEDFALMPYDQVVVRQIPMFTPDRSVQINGEVMYPGSYLLESRRVYLSELISEAGGLTEKADLRHATLIREFEDTGPVGINLDDALSNRRDERDDPIVMAGDVITIPEYHNTISIRIRATRLGELETRDVIPDDEFVPDAQDDVVTFVYQGPRSARWYIENYAGGFARDADKRSVTVTKRNGQVKGTKRRMLFFNNYPTVTPGSTISLAYEPPPEPAEEEDTVDWDRVYQRSMSATTTLLSFLVLIDRLMD